MKCPACGSTGCIVWRCLDCGDIRCTKAGCKGTMNTGRCAASNYDQLSCEVCHSKNVKMIKT